MREASRPSKGPTPIKSILKGIEVLEVLAEYPDGLELKELSVITKQPKSTLHGILSTLCLKRIVEQSQVDGSYFLGTKLFELGNVVSSHWNIREVAKRYMKQLLMEFGETVHLVKLVDKEVLYIEKMESAKALTITSRIGIRLPLYCTGVGKVLLAHMGERDIERYLSDTEFTRYTAHTIVDPVQMRKELSIIRDCEYAIDNQEFMQGLYCVATPIYSLGGNVNYAISVSGPSMRFDDETTHRIIRQVKKAAKSISADIGYRNR